MTRLCRLLSLAFAVLLVTLWISSADAQPPGGRRGGGPPPFGGPMMGGQMMGDPLMLLQSEQVQKELELIDDQKAEIQKLAEAVRGQFRDQFAALRDLSEEQRRAEFAKIQEKLRARAEDTRKKIEALLLPNQIERFDQISLQLRGPAALGDPKVQEQLKLTDQQKQELRAIQEKAAEASRSLMAGLRDLTPEARGERMRELRGKIEQITKEAGDRAMAVLTPEQRNTFNTMKGKTFEFQRPQP